MDPNAAWKIILDSKDSEERRAAASGLHEWLSMGGFLPGGWETAENGRARLLRLCALTISAIDRASAPVTR